MQISKVSVKGLILDTLIYEDELNEKGERVIRTSFPKKYFRDVKKCQDLIRQSMEAGLVKNDVKITKAGSGETVDTADITWVPNDKNLVIPEGERVFTHRFTDAEIDLPDGCIKAFKHFYEKREELPFNVDIDTMDEIDSLIK